MSFYNPYMQRPDYGQGIQDFISQLFQMMMYKKFMDSMGGEKGQFPRFPQEGSGQSSDWGSLMAQAEPPALPGGGLQPGTPGPTGVSSPFQQQPQIDPALMRAISEIFQSQMTNQGPQDSNPWTRYLGPIKYY